MNASANSTRGQEYCDEGYRVAPYRRGIIRLSRQAKAAFTGVLQAIRATLTKVRLGFDAAPEDFSSSGS